MKFFNFAQNFDDAAKAHTIARKAERELEKKDAERYRQIIKETRIRLGLEKENA